MKCFYAIRFILFFALLTFLSACGGGETGRSGQTILGVAATDIDGKFSFEVAELTPPFLLKAEWTSGAQTHRLFSVALKGGNGHSNPLSDLALRLVAGGDPAAIFGATDAAPDTLKISETSMTVTVAQIKTMLSPR